MSHLEFLSSEEVQHFLLENEDADPQKLLLNPPPQFKNQMTLVVDQIISRRKAKTKLPEWSHQKGVIFPPPLSLEQCSSPETAQYKSLLMSGELLVDLTGGMGVDTLAMCREFEQIVYVEHSEWLCDLFQHNYPQLGNGPIKVVNTSAEDYLNSFQGRGYFFIDPARRDVSKKQVFHFENCEPNVLEMLPLFQAKAERLLIKAAPMIDITLGLKQLQYVHQIHVVSVRNEVKEVLFLLDFKGISEPLIKCVNLRSEHPAFSFTLTGEKELQVVFSSVKKYLYDPNSSILKAGAFKSVADIYAVDKLAPNTHLYTSEQLIEGFPGRGFEVLEPDVRKKEIRKLLPDMKANVVTKNYPLKPEELKKRLKLKDGGDWFVIGYRDLHEVPRIAVSKRIW